MRFALRRDRAAAAFAAGLVTFGAGYWLATGFGLLPLPTPQDALNLVNIVPPRPPEVKQTPIGAEHHPAPAHAAPANLRAEPAPVVAPPITPILRPTLVAPPIAAQGFAASAGAANIAGPGTGAGGVGQGLGSGGNGDGGGGTPPRLRKGRIRDSDYPRDAGAAGVSGTVGVRYAVEIDGRASDCRVIESSGNAELDATTCKLIEARFHFDPARDAQHKPVRATIVEHHSWVIDPPSSEPAMPD